MDANAVFTQVYHHPHLYDSTQRYNGYSLGDEETKNTTMRIPTAPAPMQRFLTECEQPWSMPLIPEHEQHAMHTLPDVPILPTSYMDANGFPVVMGSHRLPSPTNSGLASSYVSSEWSGRHESPPFSPHPHVRSHSPLYDYHEGVAFAFGGHLSVPRRDSHTPEGCVALPDVQRCADELPDTFAFNNDPSAYALYGADAQEGYQPMQSGDETNSAESYSTPGTDYRQEDYRQEDCRPEVHVKEEFIKEEEEPESPREEPPQPVIRRRRAQVPRSPSMTSPVSPSRVSKRRPSVGRRSSSYRAGGYCEDDHAHCVTLTPRAFSCPLAIYGCTSTFGSKNEWKRHVSTQHMRLGYWRCDQCPTNADRKPNDFNRKDLFVQHVRRMHPLTANTQTTKKTKVKREGSTEEQVLSEAALRCYRPLRSPPKDSRCLFCEQRFHGINSWEQRMEHVGQHMENAKKERDRPLGCEEWKVDGEAEKWFVQQGVVFEEGGKLVIPA